MKDYNTGQKFDPKMKEAMAEIKAVIKKYDCAAFVLLNSPIASEFINDITPSWSVMRFDQSEKGEPAIRFRSKKGDFKTKEEQDYCTDRTVNFLYRFVEMMAHHFLAYEKLISQLKEHMEIVVTDDGKIISDNDVMN